MKVQKAVHMFLNKFMILPYLFLYTIGYMVGSACDAMVSGVQAGKEQKPE
jgi:hypothetical protein